MPAIYPDRDALVAGSVLIWVRYLITAANKDLFTRDELLVMLTTLLEDRELFPEGTKEELEGMWTD
jgi:hypothetical protein